jgi:hypothetical protein
MKMRSLPSLALTLTTATALTLWAAKAAGQESSTSTTATTPPTTAQLAATTAPAAGSQATPQLSFGVAEVVQLAHANVSEDVILNYVQNSGNGYGLDANQILYLKQQGVSDRVVNAMLAQRSRVAAQTTTPPSSSDTGTAPTATVVTQPTTYVQPASSSTVYVIPDTQTYNYYGYYYRPYYYPYYYPYYGYYGYYGWPAVSLSFGYYGGYRGGWYGGGGWHNSGGWHNGGGWHSSGGAPRGGGPRGGMHR